MTIDPTSTLLTGNQGFIAGPMVVNGDYSSAQGHRPGPGPREIAALANMVANAFSGTPFLQRGGAGSRDTRDVPAECRWPKIGSYTAEEYLDLFSSFSIAARVVEIIPKEAWQQMPSVFEDDDPEISTPFEEDWDALGQSMREWQRGGANFKVVDDDESHPAWEYLLRADILSGVGRYGIILLGVNDGLDLSQPVAGWVEDNSAPGGKAYKPDEPIDKGTTLTTNVAGVYNLRITPQAGGPRTSPLPAAAVRPGGADGTIPVAMPPNGDGKAGGTSGKPQRNLLFIQCFPEALAPVVQWEMNWTSPRYGKPVMYLVTFNDPRLGTFTGGGFGTQSPAGSTRMVHWSRVLHVADVYHHASSNDTLAAPRLQAVLPDVLDLRKVYGASAEGYWRAAFMGLGFEAHQPRPGEFGQALTPDAKDSIRKAFFDYFEGFDKGLYLEGGTVKPIAPGVVDPTPHIAARLESICIKIDCPTRVFKGSERGELASGQDEEDWNGSLRGRNRNYTTPRIIVPFVARLVALGVCRPPKELRVSWPDIGTQSDDQKASVALKKAQALAAYVAGNVETIYPPQEFMVDVMGMSEDRAEAVAEAAVEVMDERDAEAQAAADAAAEQAAQAAGPAGSATTAAGAVAPPVAPPGVPANGNKAGGPVAKARSAAG